MKGQLETWRAAARGRRKEDEAVTGSQGTVTRGWTAHAEWLGGRVDGWVDGWMDGQMDGWMDGRTDVWIDRWTDG